MQIANVVYSYSGLCKRELQRYYGVVVSRSKHAKSQLTSVLLNNHNCLSGYWAIL